MKLFHLSIFAGVLALCTSAPQAQITSAGALTKRIAPLTGRPAPPPPPQPARALAPAAPVDPEKVQAGKDEADKKKLEFQKKKAEDGAPYAQYDLGLRYLHGDGVEKDLTLAKRWINAASTNGYKIATKKLDEIKTQEKEAPAK